jgi:hypothetical protein
MIGFGVGQAQLARRLLAGAIGRPEYGGFTREIGPAQYRGDADVVFRFDAAERMELAVLERIAHAGPVLAGELFHETNKAYAQQMML